MTMNTSQMNFSGGNPSNDISNANNNAPFLDANQGTPYNFQVSDISDTKRVLYFSTYINSDKRKRRMASFNEISKHFMQHPDSYEKYDAEGIKNNFATFLGVGTGNVIKHKTSAKGIASLIIKNRAECFNYWFESDVKAGQSLYLIIKKELCGSATKKSWVFVPYAGNGPPSALEMSYTDSVVDLQNSKMGCSIFIGQCRDDHFSLAGLFAPQVRTRAILLNSCIADKACGVMEFFL